MASNRKREKTHLYFSKFMKLPEIPPRSNIVKKRCPSTASPARFGMKACT
jgi:hypothetical protein